LRRHGRRLQAQPVLANRSRRLVHDLVAGHAPRFEREVEPRQLELDADHVGGEDAQRLLEQLLARLVSLEDGDRGQLHGGGRLATAFPRNRRSMAARIGWTRTGSKRRFRYVDADGRAITDEQQLERIRALAIPPAWRDVWISPSA